MSVEETIRKKRNIRMFQSHKQELTDSTRPSQLEPYQQLPGRHHLTVPDPIPEEGPLPSPSTIK